MKAGFFITGTDTDVGKTWTTIALMRWFQTQDLTAVGMKPVAAGCELQQGTLKNSDALLMQQYASVSLEYAQINPYAFAAAVSPHLARGEVDLSLARIVDGFIDLQSLADVVLVEGAGGWCSPLSDVLDNAGLAQALGLPVILVVGVRLGCINHARLTVSAIHQTGLPCAGWVAVQIDPTMPGFDGNLAFLREVLDAPLLGVLPFSASADFELLATKVSVPNWRKFDLHQKYRLVDVQNDGSITKIIRRPHMALITWTAAQYGTNVGFADQEHQTLFGLLNKLYDEATGGAARATIGASLDALITYVVDHFAHEEREMVAKGFPGYDSHKVEHEALIGICADLQKKFHAGEAEVTEDVGQLVKGWLDSHIPKFDMAYSDALK